MGALCSCFNRSQALVCSYFRPNALCSEILTFLGRLVESWYTGGVPHRHRTESKTSPRRISAVIRGAQALAMRAEGRDFATIAKALGYKGPPGAYMAAMAALARVPEPAADAYRKLNVKRLNMIRELIWPYFMMSPEPAAPAEPNLPAIAMELRIQEREARYLGLDVQKIPQERGDTFNILIGRIEKLATGDKASWEAFVAAVMQAPALPAGQSSSEEPNYTDKEDAVEADYSDEDTAG